jgi:hypothetical protein
MEGARWKQRAFFSNYTFCIALLFPGDRLRKCLVENGPVFFIKLVPFRFERYGEQVVRSS